MTDDRRKAIAELLLHPLVLAALALWLLNDHWAKAAVGGFWPGKLSDVASLIVFPLLPVCGLALWREPPRAWVLGWLIATGAVMASINTIDAAADAYRWGLAIAQWPVRAVWGLELPELAPVALTMDPGDLATLPALAVPYFLTRRRLADAAPQAARRVSGSAPERPTSPRGLAEHLLWFGPSFRHT